MSLAPAGGMAKLVMKTASGGIREYPLQQGLNRVGRSPENEVVLEGSAVSAVHCELWLMKERLLLRDLASTNGTFVDGRAVSEIELHRGALLGIGGKDLTVVDLPAPVAIPATEPPPPPPRFTPDGLPCCVRHPESTALYRCSACGEQYCASCTQVLARRGGRAHAYCPSCHGECVSIIPPRLTAASGSPKRLPSGWLGRLTQTLRLRR